MGKAKVQDAASTTLFPPSLPVSGTPGVLSAVGPLPELLTVCEKENHPSGRLLWDSVSALSLILRAALAPAPNAALAPERVPGQAAPNTGSCSWNLGRKSYKEGFASCQNLSLGDKPNVFGKDPPQVFEISLENKQEGKVLQRVEGDAASMPTLAPSDPSSPVGTWPCAGSTFPGPAEVTQPGLLWEAPRGIGFAK